MQPGGACPAVKVVTEVGHLRPQIRARVLDSEEHVQARLVLRLKRVDAAVVLLEDAEVVDVIAR